jgi:peptide/nickel transport system substrate-binding protein
VGTGLFQVKERTDAGIVLETNPFHRLWGETMLDHIELRFYPSYEHTIAAYEAGEVLGFGPILAEDMERARANSNLQILSARLSEYGLIYLNLENPASPFFQDQRVRQALLYALDRQELIDKVLQGQGMIIHSPILPQSWAHEPGVKRYLHDPERAIELLEKAKWVLPDPNRTTFDELDPEDAKIRVKDGQRLEFTLVTNDVPNQVALAHAVADQWKEVGVRVHVQAVSISELTLDHLSPREFDAALLQWQARPDPDPYPMWHSTQKERGQNYSGFDNRDADEAIEVARQLNDRGERAELYRQFQTIFAEEVPAILLYQPTYAYGVDKQVRNVQIAPMSDPSGRFRSIYQWALLEKEIPLAELNDQVGDKLDKHGDP